MYELGSIGTQRINRPKRHPAQLRLSSRPVSQGYAVRTTTVLLLVGCNANPLAWPVAHPAGVQSSGPRNDLRTISKHITPENSVLTNRHWRDFDSGVLRQASCIPGLSFREPSIGIPVARVFVSTPSNISSSAFQNLVSLSKECDRALISRENKIPENNPFDNIHQ